MPVGAQRHPGQERRPHAGGHQRLDGHVVVAGVGGLRREAIGPAHGDQLLVAARAPGHPAALRAVGDVLDAEGMGDEVEDVVEEADRLQVLTGVVVDVGEGQGGIDPPATQGVQGLGRLGIDQLDLQARMPPGDDGEDARDQGGHRRGEGGEEDPPLLGVRHGDRLALSPLQQVDDLPSAGGQGPPLLGEADAAPRPGEQHGTGGPRQRGELVGHGGLAVAQGLGGGRDGTEARELDEGPQLLHVDHGHQVCRTCAACMSRIDGYGTKHSLDR